MDRLETMNVQKKHRVQKNLVWVIILVSLLFSLSNPDESLGFSGSCQMPNFKSCDLSYADFEGQNLAGADFTDALLLGANFKNADLTSAIFQRADLRRADLTGSLVSGASMPSANLTDAKLAGIHGKLTGTYPTDLPTPWLVKNGYFIGPGADLQGANLTGVSLVGATLDGVRSGSISGSPTLPSGWILNNGYLLGKDADLRGAEIQSSSGIRQLIQVNWGDANLSGAKIVNIKTSFPDSVNLTNATLQGCEIVGKLTQQINGLVGVNLPTTTQFSNSKWRVVQGKSVTRAMGPGANLRDVDFSRLGLDIRGLDLSYSLLNNAAFSGVSLEGTNLAGADITGANFLGADVSNANLLGAIDLGRPTSISSSFVLKDGQYFGSLENLELSLLVNQAKVGEASTASIVGLLPGVSAQFTWEIDGFEVQSNTEGYLVQPSDLGKALSVQVVLSKKGYLERKIRTFGTLVAAGSLGLTPVPTVSGTNKVGQTLTATPGTWDTGVTLSYQWLRDGAVITGANKNTFLLSTNDSGKRISVEVAGTKTGYATVKETSTAVQIEAGTLTITPTPTVSGTFKVGQLLTANPGTWDSGVTLTYQWLRDGAAITSATTTIYSLTPEDFGKQITVEVTGTKSGYATVKKASTAVTIEAGSQTLTPVPTVSGTFKVGQTLTATPGTWDTGVTLSYQWLRDGAAISGATNTSHTLSASDFGKNISFMVHGAKTAYLTVSKESSKATILAGSLTSTTPKITGTAKTGSVLKASTSTWTKGAKITYQWLANGVAIKGATSSSLKLATSHKGKKISVRVTQSALGYTTATKTSASVSVK